VRDGDAMGNPPQRPNETLSDLAELILGRWRKQRDHDRDRREADALAEARAPAGTQTAQIRISRAVEQHFGAQELPGVAVPMTRSRPKQG
jgi:hypothetical protein